MGEIGGRVDVGCTMRMLVPLLVIGAIFAVPLVLIVVFVQARAKKRMERLRGPWMGLAQRLGGQFQEGAGFTGTQILVQRPTHAIQVKMTLVSVMTAASVPYYPDGGTFTEVIVGLYPQNGFTFVPHGTKTQRFVDHTRIPALAHVGPNAVIYLDPLQARIVFHDVVYDAARLEAAVASLEQLSQAVAHHGPMPAAA